MKQKIICTLLLLACGLNPDDPAPIQQLAVEDEVAIRDIVKKQTEDDVKFYTDYYEGLYKWLVTEGKETSGHAR